MSGRFCRFSAAFLCLVAFAAPAGRADVVFDNFDPDGGFHPQDDLVAASATNLGPPIIIVRAAAQFTISGGDFTLDSVTLPISQSITVSGDFLRVRITADNAGAPGTTIEVLSEGQGIWPTVVVPFTTKTTLPSALHPTLSDGAEYWIVTELASLPEIGPLDDVAYRWYYNTSSTTVPARQQQEIDALPMDPWSGFAGPINLAFRVDGTPSVLAVPDGGARLAVGPTRNPVAGPVDVSFSLPDEGPATLVLFDVSGRRLVSREIGSAGIGRHALRLGEVPPGIYIVCLTQAEHLASARVAVLR